jgi:hypothetical protein
MGRRQSAAMLSSVVFAVQLIDARSDALAWSLAFELRHCHTLRVASSNDEAITAL